jgi:hypothetical protein
MANGLRRPLAALARDRRILGILTETAYALVLAGAGLVVCLLVGWA